MRTDSTTLSRVGHRRRPGAGPRAVRRRLRARRSRGSTPARSRTRRRPTRPSGPPGRRFRTPGEVARELDGDDFRLYELIWQRTIASQMADARGTTVSVRIARHGRHRRGRHVRRVRAHDHVPRLPQGLRRDRRRRRPAARPTTPSRRLPKLTQGQPLDAATLTPEGHATNPPPRYTEPQPDQGAGGPGHRPAVHLRVDHPDDPGPRVRVEEGRRRWSRRGSRSPWSGCWSTTSPGWSTTTSPPRWRTSSTPSPPATSGRTDWLSAFYFGGDAGPRGFGRRAPAG